MNKYNLVVTICLIFASCSEDIIIYTGSSPMPVVYCIINPTDSIHYIRLEKTVTPNMNPAVYEPSDPQLYYVDPILDVGVYTVNRKLLNRLRVTESSTHAKKDSNGIFKDSNLAYSFSNNDIQINFLESIYYSGYLSLSIQLQESPYFVSSYTQIPPKGMLKLPRSGYPIDIDLYSEYSWLTWLSRIELYHELDIVLNVTAHNNHEIHTIKVVMVKSFPPFSNVNSDSPGFFKYKLRPESIVMALRNELIKTQTEYEYYKLGKVDIVLRTSTQDFFNYYYLSRHDSDFPVQESNNITNGIGVFAVYQEDACYGNDLHPYSIDSIINNEILKNFNFRKY